MCSRMPMVQLPPPSKLFGFKPRKSRTRGSAMFTSRSTNSYMRDLRKVTLQPIALPSRSLKLTFDLRFLASDFSFLSAIDLNSRALGKAHLLAVAALADELEADARRLAVLGVGDRQIRQVDRRLLGDDAALLLRGLALVALDHVHAAHE